MPGKSCSVAACNNSNSKIKTLNLEKKVIFHNFPTDPLVCKIWVQRCRRSKALNPLTSSICSEHFTSDDYKRDLQSELLGLPLKKRLKPRAVPSLNLGSTNFLSGEAKRKKDEEQRQIFEKVFKTANHMEGYTKNIEEFDSPFSLQSDPSRNEESYEPLIDTSDPPANYEKCKDDSHSNGQATSSQTSVVIKTEPEICLEEKNEEYLCPEFGSEMFCQSEHVENEKVENNAVIKFTIYQLSGNEQGTESIIDVINQIQKKKLDSLLQKSCKNREKKCKPEKRICKTKEKICKTREKSCGAEQESCGAEQEICGAEQERCGVEQESCGSKQESCKAKHMNSKAKREIRRKQKTVSTPGVEVDDSISRLKKPIETNPILAYVLMTPSNKESKTTDVEDNQLDKANSTACSSTADADCESNPLSFENRLENCQRLPQMSNTATSRVQKRYDTKKDPAYAALLASAAVYYDESRETTSISKINDSDSVGTTNTSNDCGSLTNSSKSNDCESSTNSSKTDDSRQTLKNYLVSKLKPKRPLYYQCAVCSRKVKNAAKFVIHTRTHTGEKPFKCNICGRAFATKPPLKRHQLVHTGERPHLCPTCGKTFAKGDNLLVHMRRHSGVKPFACNTCGKRFFEKCFLVHHMEIHNRENEFKCAKCGKRYWQKRSLMLHMKKYCK